MQENIWIRFTAVVLLLGIMVIALFIATSVWSRPLSASAWHVAPPLKGPVDHRPAPVIVTPQAQLQSGGLKAIAIVGEVGDVTQLYKDDMQYAVDALEDHGVTVYKFFYGDSAFTWSDIVAAANGAHFLLYMGHGVYWGDSCVNPTEVGGFYLGSEFVSPDQIRNDLGGKLAEDSVAILSHACFSAGDSACDPEGTLTQVEAERRVRMYAAPFVDIGMEAYYANNNYYSASNIVNQLLTDPSQRKSVGEIFKSISPFSAGEFRDLTYPDSGYDLWLSGSTGHWSDAFVGMPGYVFAGDLTTPPELGGLPETLAFAFNQATSVLSPDSYTVTPENVGNSDPLTWTITTGCAWLDFSPETATTPEPFGVMPNQAAIAALPEGQHTGTFTVTVTDPAETLNAVQRVEVTLDIVRPRLGNLPAELNFTYLISDALMLPRSHVVTPRNVGSEDVLTWDLEQAGTWFETSVTSGTTPGVFTITPISYSTTQSMSYTGCVTVTATAPIGTDDAVQRIDLTLQVRVAEAARVFLPLVTRN
ncbi:MAG: hypothetical protein ACP5HM_03720 [Anaerolineae bacterium]